MSRPLVDPQFGEEDDLLIADSAAKEICNELVNNFEVEAAAKDRGLAEPKELLMIDNVDAEAIAEDVGLAEPVYQKAVNIFEAKAVVKDAGLAEPVYPQAEKDTYKVLYLFAGKEHQGDFEK